jgi:hypothetical protein
MKLNKTQKMLIATGVTLIAGALFFSSKALASGGQTNILPGNDDGIIVTNHDMDYDYKYKGKVWYSRKKGSLTWINLKKTLTPEKYVLAESRLRKYLS